MEYKNVKIFDVDTKNCRIKNTHENIFDLFFNNKIPIVNKIYDLEKERLFTSEEVDIIGYVKSVDKIEDGRFYGTVIVFDDIYFSQKFINWSVIGDYVDDGEFCITRIESIQII